MNCANFEYTSNVKTINGNKLKEINDFLKTGKIKTKDILSAIEISKYSLQLPKRPKLNHVIILYGFSEAVLHYHECSRCNYLTITVKNHYANFWDNHLFAVLLSLVITKGYCDIDFKDDDWNATGFRCMPGKVYKKYYKLIYNIGKKPIYLAKET